MAATGHGLNVAQLPFMGGIAKGKKTEAMDNIRRSSYPRALVRAINMTQDHFYAIKTTVPISPKNVTNSMQNRAINRIAPYAKKPSNGAFLHTMQRLQALNKSTVVLLSTKSQKSPKSTKSTAVQAALTAAFLPETVCLPPLTGLIFKAVAFLLCVRLFSAVCVRRGRDSEFEEGVMETEGSRNGMVVVYDRSSSSKIEYYQEAKTLRREPSSVPPVFRISFNVGFLLCFAWAMMFLGWCLEKAWELFVLLTSSNEKVEMMLKFARGSELQVSVGAGNLLRVSPLVILTAGCVAVGIARSVTDLVLALLRFVKALWIRADRIYDDLPSRD